MESSGITILTGIGVFALCLLIVLISIDALRKHPPTKGVSFNNSIVTGISVVLLFSIVGFVVMGPTLKKDQQSIAKKTFITKTPETVTLDLSEVVTKVKLKGADIVYQFDVLKPIYPGQAFYVIKSTASQVPAVSLCDAVAVEYVGKVDGKNAHTEVITSQKCYRVTVAASQMKNIPGDTSILEPSLQKIVSIWAATVAPAFKSSTME